MRTLPCISEVCNGTRKVCKLGKNKCMHNKLGGGLSQKKHIFRGDVQANIMKSDKGVGVSKK